MFCSCFCLLALLFSSFCVCLFVGSLVFDFLFWRWVLPQPTILDLHSGALSLGSQFIDVYRAAASSGMPDLFSGDDFAAYG